MKGGMRVRKAVGQQSGCSRFRRSREAAVEGSARAERQAASI
jgi:hypothetical protein